jgi:hypothetical protein
MSHDRCRTMQAIRARGDRALQYVVDEIVRILQDAAPAGPGKEG